MLFSLLWHANIAANIHAWVVWRYSASRLRRQTLRRLRVFVGMTLIFGIAQFFVYQRIRHQRVRPGGFA